MATASNLQLLVARSPLSCCGMFWPLLWPLEVLPGTTSGGPLARLTSDVGCWGVCSWELVLALLLSTAKEHELSVVTTLMVITAPSMAPGTGLTVVLYHPLDHVGHNYKCLGYQSLGSLTGTEIFCPISWSQSPHTSFKLLRGKCIREASQVYTQSMCINSSNLPLLPHVRIKLC